MVATNAHRASARKTAFGGEIELRFPFCQDLIDALKELPSRSRKWDMHDGVWRVQGVHAPAAIALLLEHFPNAEVPSDQVRPGRLVARTERLPTPRPPLPPLIVATRAPDDQPALDPLLAVVACPTCHTRYTQPVRVIAETSLTVAKRETMAPELVAVCPSCTTVAVVAFYPTAAPVTS